MNTFLKVSATVTALGMAVLGMTGCADLAAINAQGVQDRARILGSAQSGGYAMAAQLEQSKPAQVTIPKDKRVAAAIEEALPMVKKVLAIHQCVQNWEALRQLNALAVPGVNMAQMGSMIPELRYPNSDMSMKYHNRNKCVGGDHA